MSSRGAVCSRSSAGLLPGGRRRASSSCMCGPPPAPASRGPSRFSRRSRTRFARSFPARTASSSLDNIGLPQRHYNLAFTDGSDDRRQRRRDPGRARSDGHAPTEDMSSKLRAELPAFPGRALLFPARRYRDADPEFRRADADRRAVHGRDRDQEPEIARSCSRGSRCRASSTSISSRRSTRPNSTTRSTAAARSSLASTVSAIANNLNDQPELVGAGLAEFLDRYEDRHPLLPGSADARI